MKMKMKISKWIEINFYKKYSIEFSFQTYMMRPIIDTFRINVVKKVYEVAARINSNKLMGIPKNRRIFSISFTSERHHPHRQLIWCQQYETTYTSWFLLMIERSVFVVKFLFPERSNEMVHLWI